MTAQLRGISSDELADMIVPHFGFQENKTRHFASEASECLAILQPDLKIHWITDHRKIATASLPTNLTEAAQNEFKAIRSELTKVKKQQSLRLEMAMTSQRRWSLEQWKTCFLKHPTLNHFATTLIWGTYNSSNHLELAFILQPDGSLNNNSGEPVQFTDTPPNIGIVHPVELDQSEVKKWKNYITRQKIKPFFKQIKRETYILNQDHSAQSSIDYLEGKEDNASDLKKKFAKLSWSMSPPEDGGRVHSFTKTYKSITMRIEVTDMHITSDHTDMITLGIAEVTEHKKPTIFGNLPKTVYSDLMVDVSSLVKNLR